MGCPRVLWGLQIGRGYAKSVLLKIFLAVGSSNQQQDVWQIWGGPC